MSEVSSHFSRQSRAPTETLFALNFSVIGSVCLRTNSNVMYLPPDVAIARRPRRPRGRHSPKARKTARGFPLACRTLQWRSFTGTPPVYFLLQCSGSRRGSLSLSPCPSSRWSSGVIQNKGFPFFVVRTVRRKEKEQPEHSTLSVLSAPAAARSRPLAPQASDRTPPPRQGWQGACTRRMGRAFSWARLEEIDFCPRHLNAAALFGEYPFEKAWRFISAR